MKKQYMYVRFSYSTNEDIRVRAY